MDIPDQSPTDRTTSGATDVSAAATPQRQEDPQEDPHNPLVCATCGASPAPGEQAAARLTWSRGTEGGRTTWTCEACSRENLRSIESKLDPAWW